MKITNQKGFSLLEITLVLGVGSAMAFMKFQDMKSDQENIMANTVGSQMKQMGEAVNRYISIRYDKLSTLTSSSSQSSDPGPRTCSANGCEITYQTLLNEGLLPVSYTGINAQKSAYKILLKRAGIAPNYVINGLVITTLPWSEGNRVRYDLLGRAMQAAGIDSGMTQSATVASGTAGQWTENQSNYSGINAAGLLAYRVGYDSSMYSVYLRRDGTLPMTGDLNMGGKNIINTNNITAEGMISGKQIVASQQVKGFNGQFTNRLIVGGVEGDAGWLEVKGQSTFKDGASFSSYASVDGRVMARGGISVQNVENNTVKDVIRMEADGNIVSSGNMSSEKTVSGEYLQPKSISVVGASCSPDGLISKDNKGATLSCQSGVWRENSGGLITLDGNTCSAGSEPVLYYASKAVFWGGQVRTNPYGDQKLWVPEYNINETQAHCTTSGGGEKGEKENCRTIPKYINITQVKCG
ncbi:shufflon system plasmid conjugative transfer pilus tip adhesin PilV [Pectobacterium polonicum]|uniref:shufflon system plasmid conjugative transfer pilus tip adhesin PilV n=1 Tax=Pectobacterium polonicum TaxID=2485124 RepID=UPI002B255541|nr:shufflon system plasmid conjugative transfer pilus tip adhesin PilV [Pectobacterium polonicum]